MSNGFFGSEEFFKNTIDDIEDFEEDGQSLADDIGGFGLIGVGNDFEAIADGGDRGINFSALAFADDTSKHLDDVVIGAIDIFAVAGSAVSLNDPPLGEVAEIH